MKRKSPNKFSRPQRGMRCTVLVPSMCALIIGLALIWSLFILLYTPIPHVQTVDVVGATRTPPALIVSLVSAHVLQKHGWRARLGPNNILFWKSGEVPNMQKYAPHVARVQVEKDIGKKAVTIRVEEKTISALWCYIIPRGEADDAEDEAVHRRENCYAVDEQGIAFIATPTIAGNLLIKVYDTNEPARVLRARVLARDEWFNLMKGIEAIRRAGLHPTAITIRERTLREWEVETKAGPSLYLSLETVQDDIGGILEELAVTIDFKTVRVIDLRVKDKIYYK